MRTNEPEPSVHIEGVIIPQPGSLFLSAACPYWVNEEKGGSDGPDACKHAQNIDKLPSYLIIMSLYRWLSRSCLTSCVCSGIASSSCILELVYSMVHRSEKIHEESTTFCVRIICYSICLFRYYRIGRCRVYCWCRHYNWLDMLPYVIRYLTLEIDLFYYN